MKSKASKLVDKIFITGVGKSMCFIALLFALVSFSSATVFAYDAQEYETSKSWSEGTLVSLKSDSLLTEASRTESSYIGTVTKQVSQGRVEVANEGVIRMLVLQESTPIVAGDKLGLSQVAGVAAKWYSGAVLAIVQSSSTDWQEVTLGNGQKTKVGLAKVQLIDEGASAAGSNGNIFFSAIERTASGVAGRPVDTWKILTAMFIATGGLILSFGLLFISSRESFFSFGRNPMASRTIMSGLWKIVALSVLILCTTLTAAYLIVRIQ